MMSLQPLKEFQDKYDNWDTDTIINEIRDAYVARLLGYNLINKSKHGFDAKKSNEEKFLEIKNCSYGSSSFSGTWNDTTIEKAKAFQTNKVETAVGIWRGATDLLCAVYGSHIDLGNYLEEKVHHFKAGKTVRSTQSISVSKMLKDFNFNIKIGTGQNKSDIKRLLISKNNVFKEYFDND